jgi:prepilin-type N-terminal cleavage/methylation domain-containing protein/prepilin-type processing-associated H-X9-DG protein
MHSALRSILTSRLQAFTLVELLVVLAIISLLAALLLAGVKVVRDSSKSAACQNNLRQIGLSVVAYTMQNDDYLPPASVNSTLAPNYASDCIPGLLITTMDLTYPVLTTSPTAPVKSVFMCPASGSTVMGSPMATWAVANFATSDEANGYVVWKYREPSGGTYRYFTQSYTANAIVNNWPSPWPLEEFTTNVGSTLTGKPLSKISKPSNTIMMFDGGFLFHNGGIARMAARHRNRTLTNLLFFDGHVAAFPTVSDLQPAFLLRDWTAEKRFNMSSWAGASALY